MLVDLNAIEHFLHESGVRFLDGKELFADAEKLLRRLEGITKTTEPEKVEQIRTREGARTNWKDPEMVRQMQDMTISPHAIAKTFGVKVAGVHSWRSKYKKKQNTAL